MERSIRCTIHWFEGDQPKQQDLLFANRPIGDLIPILVESLGLPRPVDVPLPDYGLRPGPRAPAWPTQSTPAEVGIRDGGHVWLTIITPPPRRPIVAAPRRPAPRCSLTLADGSTVALPPQGLALTRGWLLEHLSRTRQMLEQVRFWLGRSPYQFVSARAPHCTLRPIPNGVWVVETARDDVETSLNGALMAPGRPYPLRSGDQLQPGVQGPTLTVVIDSV